MLNFLDFECYPKLWTVTIINPTNGKEWQIVNDVESLRNHYNAHKNEIYVTFNGRQYDDWIFKALLCGFSAWEMNDWLINKKRKGFEFSSLLNKVRLNSFDCMIGFNGLKTLEAFKGMSIEETKIPFDYDGEFTQEMIDEVLEYNRYDVLATIEVFVERKAEFNAYMKLIKMFDLPLSYIGKSKAQMAAKILGATRHKYNDEFDIQLPPTAIVEKHKDVLDFYLNGWNYESGSYVTEVNGVWHKFGTGGIHGADGNVAVMDSKTGKMTISTTKSIPTYHEGELLHIDVASYYPSLNIEYPDICLSRSIPKPEMVRELRDLRLSYKRSGDADTAYALKILINALGGAMKDKGNPMYDPRQNNNMCIGGQILLLDLLEKLEGKCHLCQSNTDGIIVKLHGNRDEVVAICKEWEKRTRMELEYHDCVKLIQKDVNNYVLVFANGKIETTGGYVKELDNLDYDLAIVNRAVKDYMLRGIPVEHTVNSCTDIRDFQKVVKLSNLYEWVEHENGQGTTKFDNKAYRTFASLDNTDGMLKACRNTAKGLEKKKFGGTADNCFIYNGDLTGVDIPSKLDRGWYINLAKSRLEDFGYD